MQASCPPPHTHTINGIAHTPNVHMSPPTHATVVVPEVCGLHAPCSPLRILRHLRFSTLSLPHQAAITQPTTRGFMGEHSPFSLFVLCELHVFCLIYLFIYLFVNRKSSVSGTLQQPGSEDHCCGCWGEFVGCSGLLGAVQAAAP